MTSKRRRFLGALLVAVAGACGQHGSSTTAHPDKSSDEVVALVTGTMNAEGRRVLYSAEPRVLDKAEFAAACPNAERRVVLGCYRDGKIYILRVLRPELAGVMQVTAAHEMLHAAYAALSDSERRRVSGQLNDFYAGVTDQGFRNLVADYERDEPGERLNELHLLVPTQVGSLSPVLEKYYRRYFTFRGGVVGSYQRYRTILDDSKRRIDELVQQLSAMKSQLEALELRVNAEKAALQELDGRLGSLKAQGRIAAFNQLVPQQNAAVSTVRGLIEQYNQLVSVHNERVDTLNALALEQNQLVDSLRPKLSISPSSGP